MSGVQPGKFHYGRSFSGPGPIEASCPCPKELCGLVQTPSPECDQHSFASPRTIRVMHMAQDCPGAPDAQ